MNFKGTTIFTIVLVSLTLIGGISAKQLVQLDPTTGQPMISNNHRYLSAQTHTSQTGAMILWDTHHGVYNNYRPNGRYSGWRALMQAKGHTVVEESGGILEHELIGYDILVINLGSAWTTAYSPKEVAMIEDFVAGGGALLLLGDNGFTPNQNLQLIADTFGTSLGLNVISPLDVRISSMANHLAFSGVESLFFRAAGEINALTPVEALAWTENGETILASRMYGRGRVFITGDINFMDNTYIIEANNQRFVENLIDWLYQGTPINRETL